MRKLISRWNRPTASSSTRRTRRAPALRLESLEDRIVMDNTFGSANNLGPVAGQVLRTDFVGSSDTDDFYKLTITNPGAALQATISGLSADADLYVYDGAQNLIGSSTAGGTANDSVSLSTLTPGTYYVRVHQFVGDTVYNLSVTTDYAGASTAAARNVGTLNGQKIFRDFVGSSDPNDYYRIQTAANGNLNLSLTGLSNDADLAVYDVNGNFIASSTNGGTTSELLSLGLNKGTYYVRVYQFSGDTNYTLTATTDYAGNTFSNPRIVGNLTNVSRTYHDFVGNIDAQDYYLFNLTTARNFTATLSSLKADADLFLYDSAQNLIASSTLGGTSTDSLSAFLSAGTYYVRVGQFSGSTNYSLALTG